MNRGAKRKLDVKLTPARCYVFAQTQRGTAQTFRHLRNGFRYNEPTLDGYELFLFRVQEDRGQWTIADPASGRWPYKNKPYGGSRVGAVLEARRRISTTIGPEKIMDKFVKAVFNPPPYFVWMQRRPAESWARVN